MEGSGGRGEVRRLHIIYFLSRMGHVEHPHLIRLRHLNPTGVYLRDVKRWLGELRGKDMPENFAWSYKRRYKNGYVWQDLLDDDLITPISDNEYVLKGSQIISQFVSDTPQPQPHTKPSSQIHRESPVFVSDRSTITDDSIEREQDKEKEEEEEEMNHGKKEEQCNSHVLSKSLESDPVHSKSKSSSSGASQMFRNLIHCGGIETEESVLVKLRREDDKPKICRGGEKQLGGSCSREFRTPWNQQQLEHNHNDNDNHSRHNHSAGKSSDSKSKNKKKAFPAAYKPTASPSCSQCGKSFKPEKMHSHMKSCPGMKAFAKKLSAIS